jgi:hypothetical protein
MSERRKQQMIVCLLARSLARSLAAAAAGAGACWFAHVCTLIRMDCMMISHHERWQRMSLQQLLGMILGMMITDDQPATIIKILS